MNKQKVALVTGAAGRIGTAICLELQQAGYSIIALDHNEKGLVELKKKLTTDSEIYTCDLRNTTAIEQTFIEINSNFTRIDVLVNNAAVGPSMRQVVETLAHEFEETFEVNWIAPLQLVQKVLPLMQSENTSIIHISSGAGLHSNPKRNAYAASKAALISLTKSLACELAKDKIRVNAIAPGYIKTDMLIGLEKDNLIDLNAIRQRIPMGRLGRPDEIAKVVGFLASERATYVTGSVVSVDGGYATFNQLGEACTTTNLKLEQEEDYPVHINSSRVVVITGAARGIGRATADAFAAQGDTLVLLDYDAQAINLLKQQFTAPHLVLQVDIADEVQIQAAFAQIKARFSHIDVMINNAAIADTFAPIQNQPLVTLRKILATNVTGSFVCAREAIQLMPKSGGVVVNFGSINTHLPFAPRHAYGASKAAIEMISRCMTAELAQQGIRIVTVCPGYIRTPGVAELERTQSIDTQKINRRIPLGHLGQPKNIADAALFLASTEASYMNGATLYVDGGWSSFGNAGHASEAI